MERPNYFRAAVCGLIATYIMSVAGQWGVSIGLPRMDPGKLMAFSFGQSPLWLGEAAHFANGLVLGMMYARWEDKIPGEHVWVKGVMVGVITTVGAMIVSGMVTPRPFIKPLVPMIASLFLHLIFGITLAYAYSREGEKA